MNLNDQIIMNLEMATLICFLVFSSDIYFVLITAKAEKPISH